MRIQHNIMAMNAYRNYNTNVAAMKSNLEKLSSGYKINRAGDDAAGLAISEKMRAQITGLNAAQKNVKDGISLVQTAEGAMQEVQDMLNRMVYLGTQSANGTYDNEVDRLNLQKEVEQLKSEINRIADSANFNGIKLLDGTPGLNKDAFTIADAAAVTSQPITDIITTAMPTAKAQSAGGVAGTDTILHKSGGEAQKGFFTVDLSQMKVEAKDGTTKAKVDVTIGGVAITVEAATAGATLTGKDIAAGVKAELDKLTGNAGLMVDSSGAWTKGVAAATANKGALLYEVTNNGDGTLTFNATKYSDGTAWKALDEGLPTDDVADGALVTPGLDVTVADNGTTTKSISGNPNIDATNTQTPQKPGKTEFGNTFLTIDVTKLTEGVEMTIAGETHTFGDDDIKISDLDLTQNADKLKLMDRITQAFADNQHVSVGQDAGSIGKLTLAEKTDGAGKSLASEEMQDKMSTLAGFQSLVSFQTAAKNAGTEITINNANVKEGNALTIDGTKYVFTTDLTGKTDTTDVKYVQFTKGGTDAATNLQAKIGGTSEINGNVVTVRAASATAAAPKVLGKGLTMQIGDTADDYNQLSVVIGDIHCKALGIDGISIGDQDSAAAAIQKIKDAINTVSSIRGDLGATQNRLEHTANNLSVMTENIQDAESSIRDTDVAEEMMAYTKNNILIQAAQAMLAQANQVPQGVLQLLQ